MDMRTVLPVLFFSAALLAACGDTEQPPTGGAGAGTGATGATGATGGGGSGGATGGGGSGGATGGGGSGGSGGCVAAGDCGISDDCHFFTCDAGMCSEAFAPAGTQTTAQVLGDCKLSVCDGAGQIASQNDDTDISSDQNECTEDTCVDGTAMSEPVPSGATCSEGGGTVCDGAGACVECVSNADCMMGICGPGNVCITELCNDAVKNGSETDVDCGGMDCPPCVPGDECLLAADCTSGICSGNPLTCQQPTCSDGVKNGMETGLDCGGSCPDCPDGQMCLTDNDCQNGYCNAGLVCATPTCMDMAKNGTETDVDCGGAACPTCADGELCSTGADCTSTFCAGNPKSCQAMLNGCTLATAQDMTGQPAVTINFGSFFYTPKCVKVSTGTQVTWSGTFSAHPLQGGAVVNNVGFPDNAQIPLTNTGMSKTITFPTAGAYPYYCVFHVNSMQGVVFVQ